MHLGTTRTHRDLKKNYWWQNIKRNMVKFMSRCLVYQQIKAKHHRPARLLKKISVPESKWEHIAMNFIVGLLRFKKHRDAI